MRYPQVPKVGSTVSIVSGGYGAYGVNGRIGVVVDRKTKSEAGAGNDSPLKVEVEGVVWALASDGYNVNVLSQPKSSAEQKTTTAFEMFDEFTDGQLGALLETAGVKPCKSRAMKLQQALLVWFRGDIPSLSHFIELARGCSS